MSGLRLRQWRAGQTRKQAPAMRPIIEPVNEEPLPTAGSRESGTTPAICWDNLIKLEITLLLGLAKHALHAKMTL